MWMQERQSIMSDKQRNRKTKSNESETDRKRCGRERSKRDVRHVERKKK